MPTAPDGTDAPSSPLDSPTQPMSSGDSTPHVLGPLDPTLAPPIRIRSGDPLTSCLSLDRSYHTLASTPAPGSMRALKLPQVPGYEILGELGRGGMGVVYRARQIRLNRFVALKMLLHADDADLSDVMRFRSEAEAVAAIKHPHVVQVHEFGHHDGQPYFAMELLSGGTLYNRIRMSAPLEPKFSAELVEKLARAVHEAHAQGIVHRDLKPGNILYDEAGEPRITDFGLAKRVAIQLTQTQAVMGTPAYMSPEQASGRTKFVGPPTDIYALGVILYECLTGKPPFAGFDSIAVLNQVLNDSPRGIRPQVRTVPRDLELICLKCLEKLPADRYATAEALAEDLGRFVAGKPVGVRPAGPIERAVKWARRRPTMATVYALSAIVLLVSTVGLGFVGLWRQAVHARDEADAHSRTAVAATVEVEAQRRAAEDARDLLAQQNKVVEVALGGERKASADAKASAKLAGEATAIAQEAKSKAEVAKGKFEELSYFSNVGFANLEVRQGNVQRAMQLLDHCPAHRRDWEWWHSYRAVHGELGSGASDAGTMCMDAAFETTGFKVTTCDVLGNITRFDFATGRGVTKAVPKADAKFHFYSRLSDDATRLLTVKIEQGRGGPDDIKKEGPFLPECVEIWDTATGHRLKAFTATGNGAFEAAISGDGTRALVGFTQPRHMVTFDIPTGKVLATLKDTSPYETQAGLNRDGSKAIAERNGEFIVWDTVTGEVIAAHRTKFGRPRAMAVNADGSAAYAGTYTGGLAFLDIRTGQAVEVEKAHAGKIIALALSRDGELLASSGEDGIVRVWNARTGAIEQVLRGHTRGVISLKFDATGRRLASTAHAMRFLVWHMDGTKQAIVKLTPPAELKGRIFTDGAAANCFAIADDGTGIFWNIASGRVDKLAPPPGEKFTAFAFAPQGTRFAAGTDSGGVHLWESGGTLSKLAATFQYHVRELAFSADGGRLAATEGYRLEVIDAKSREVLLSKPCHNCSICISADGRVAAAGITYSATAWNIDTKKSCETSSAEVLSSLALSPDGEVLAVGTTEWRVGLFDLWKPKPLEWAIAGRMLNGHNAAVVSMAFHPKGHRLVTGAADGTIKVWDPVSQYEAIGVDIGVREPIRSVFFNSGDANSAGKDIVATPDKYPPFVLHGGPRGLVIAPVR